MGTLYTLGAPPADRLYSLSLDVGLAMSSDGSCSWRRSGGVLADVIATDYFPDPVDPARVLAIVGAAGRRRLPAAAPCTCPTDGGASFAATPIYVAPAGAELLGVEIARADPRVIYLSHADRRARSRGSCDRATAARPGPTLDVEPSLGAQRGPHHRHRSGRSGTSSTCA